MSEQALPTLEDAKKYYKLVNVDGMPKKLAATQLSIKRRNVSDTVKVVENSEVYKLVFSTADQAMRAELKKEVSRLKVAQIRAYKKLLDKGEEMMEQGDSMDAMIKAQENQRRNINMDVIERTSDWDGEGRNKLDHGDALAGVIIS